MLVTFLFLTVIFYIKFISFIVFLIFFIANYESNQILTKKTYNTGERYTNFSIRPRTMLNTPDNVPIGTILFNAYWNLVFNLTYVKIAEGRWFFLKNINFKNIIVRLLLIYIGISKFLIKLLIHIIKINKEKDLETYLFLTFANFSDNRLILKINNEFKINNGKNAYIWLVKGMLSPEIKNEKIQEKILMKIGECYDRLKEIQTNTIFFNALFVEKDKPQIPHKTFLQATNENKTVGYQTSYQNAYCNSFYGKKPIINQYQGVSKKSTLLPSKITELKQISDEKRTSNIQQIYGAYRNGYDKNILSKEYRNAIESIQIIDIQLKEIFEEEGVDLDIEIRDWIFSNMIIYVGEDDSFMERILDK